MHQSRPARAVASHRSIPTSTRPTTLLVAGALCLIALGAQAIPQSHGRWIVLSSHDGSMAYAPVATETACRAAQADAAVICVSGSDMRSIADEQVIASR
jgi:hypothetical protein